MKPKVILISTLMVSGLGVGLLFQNCSPNKLTAAKSNKGFFNLSSVSEQGALASANYASSSNSANQASPSAASSTSTPAAAASPSAPTGSFGGGGSGSSSAPAAPSFVASQPQASNPITGVTFSNSGLSYDDAVRLRETVKASGKLPYVYTDASGGFTVIGLTSSDSNYWIPIQNILQINGAGDWTKIVGFKVNDVAAALGYMPNDMYRACINSGLVVNRSTNGLIVGSAPSLGCKTGTFKEYSQTVKWSCNCTGDFSSWNGMGTANCYQKLAE